VDLLRRRLAQYDADTAEAIDTAADLAKYEKELQIGREIQAGFLPDTLPAPAGWHAPLGEPPPQPASASARAMNTRRTKVTRPGRLRRFARGSRRRRMRRGRQ